MTSIWDVALPIIVICLALPVVSMGLFLVGSAVIDWIFEVKDFIHHLFWHRKNKSKEKSELLLKSFKESKHILYATGNIENKDDIKMEIINDKYFSLEYKNIKHEIMINILPKESDYTRIAFMNSEMWELLCDYYKSERDNYRDLLESNL